MERAVDRYQVVWCCTEVEIERVMEVEMLPEVAGRLHLGGVFNREPWEGSPRLPTPPQTKRSRLGMPRVPLPCLPRSIWVRWRRILGFRDLVVFESGGGALPRNSYRSLLWHIYELVKLGSN